MIKKESILYRINKISALLFVIWVCWPWFCQNTGLVGGFLIAFGWCATAVLMHDKYTVGNDGFLMAFYAIYMIISFLITGRTYGEFQLYHYISMVTLFFLPYYMARFYSRKKDLKFMGVMAIVAIICMIIGCITSTFYTSIDENIMKTISQGLDTEFLEYRKAGIGSFGFVYMVMFSIIAIIGLYKGKLVPKNLKIKILLVVFCIVGIKCLFDSTFATSILLLFVGLLLLLVTINNSKSIIYFFVLIITILASRLIGKMLTTIELESIDVTTRLHEIGNLLMGEDGGTNTVSRMEYFIRSVNCFFEYPIFGYNFQSMPVVSIGGHSEWVDILGVYGMLGGIPLIATIIIKLKRTFDISAEIKYPYYGILTFVFVVFGFVDPFLRLYHLGFVMFLLIPCIGCISETFKKEGEVV